MVGKRDKETGEASLYTHQRFEFEYNNDQIISAQVKPENLVVLTDTASGVPIDFTYSVHWKSTTRDFKTRFERYLDSDFFENKVLPQERDDDCLFIIFFPFKKIFSSSVNMCGRRMRNSFVNFVPNNMVLPHFIFCHCSVRSIGSRFSTR